MFKFNWQSFLIALIIGLVILAEFWQLGKNPVALYWDELAIGIDAYSVAQTGKDIYGHNRLQAIYPSYGDYKAPVAIWLTSLSVKFLGLSEFSVRLPFFLASLFGSLGI